VDDDASIRQALARLFQSVQLRAEGFASPQEFLQSERPDAPSCLVLDVRLPGLSGLDFQAELARADVRIPIVFISGHGDIPMTVRAMKAGAIDFLAKPFRDQDLLDAVTAAIQRDQQRREHENTMAELKAHFSSLTPREREIMALVASGLMSKQIAAEVGLSEITVKVHRSHIMKKMRARSVADLVRMAEALGVKSAPDVVLKGESTCAALGVLQVQTNRERWLFRNLSIVLRPQTLPYLYDGDTIRGLPRLSPGPSKKGQIAWQRFR
jgi:FixJ family two-component response regulator